MIPSGKYVRVFNEDTGDYDFEHVSFDQFSEREKGFYLAAESLGITGVTLDEFDTSIYQDNTLLDCEESELDESDTVELSLSDCITTSICSPVDTMLHNVFTAVALNYAIQQ
jgi:hypothetical protein